MKMPEACLQSGGLYARARLHRRIQKIAPDTMDLTQGCNKEGAGCQIHKMDMSI